MTVRILTGDCRDRLKELPSESVNCVVTSPPYFGLRDYGVAGQIGLEASPDEFVAELVAVFREVRRVLKDDGTLWLNLGDSYASTTSATGARGGSFESERAQWQGEPTRKAIPKGLKQKDLIGIPWRVAFALQADGWWLRQDIIWSKPNPMPESVTDRCTKAHEYLFLLSKGPRYYYDADAIKEDFVDSRMGASGVKNGVPEQYAEAARGGGDRGLAAFRGDATGRNRRSVWTVATAPFADAHFATFPPDLIEPCIKAGCPAGGTVLDPFGGAGTTGLVADRLGRNAILIELNPDYAVITDRRCRGDSPMFADVSLSP